MNAESAFFHAWVANAIQDLGGNPEQYLRDVQEQWPLTFSANRMAACQGGYFPSVGSLFEASALDWPSVSAHIRVLH